MSAALFLPLHAVAAWTPMDTYGLDTYGLDTYGLDTYGFDTYGYDI